MNNVYRNQSHQLELIRNNDLFEIDHNPKSNQHYSVIVNRVQRVFIRFSSVYKKLKWRITPHKVNIKIQYFLSVILNSFQN